MTRRCAWCEGPIPDRARRDAITCSKRCRQARHRFLSQVGRPGSVDPGQPRRLAYADPPYPGLSRRYYGDHPDYAGEVDHADLIERLVDDFDAWALSTSATALPTILPLCPPGVRVAAWVKGPRVHATAGVPLSSWEPVLYGGAIRRRPDPSSGRTTRRVDSLVAGPAPRTTDPGRVIGAKPPAFARWIFELLDAQPGDDLVDVFPGSGGVARAWQHYAGGSPVEAPLAGTLPT